MLWPILGAAAALEMGIISLHPDKIFMHSIQQTRTGPTSRLKGEPATRELLIKLYPAVFQDKIGCLQGKLALDLNENAIPVQTMARRVPIAMREPLQLELERLARLGIIEKIDEPTEWTSPMIVARKRDGKMRICIDPQALNKALKRSVHPVPTVEQLLPDLCQAKVFSKCDVKHGFWHIQLTDDSSKLTTFATPFGRYFWKRMPFGIKPAPEIFQRRLEQALEGLPGVKNIHDDVIIYGEGETWAEAERNHDERMEALLQRCEEQCIVLNTSEEKLIVKARELPYMGHVFSSDGLKPDPGKVRAIQHMPEPEDAPAVRRFIGMATYLAKFIPNMSDLTAPLRECVKVDSEKIEWNELQRRAFNDVKQAIARSSVLKYFDPSAQTVVQCDASSTGLGAALLQDEQPVIFASRSLTSTEQNYCQLEKELLAVVFALQRFDQYVYGRAVIVESDHQPLETISKKPLRDAPRRIQRMMLELQRYHVTITYKRGTTLVLADTLSRAYLPETEEDPTLAERVFHTNTGQEIELVEAESEVVGISDERLQEIAEHTAADSSLQQLKDVITHGWPDRSSSVQEVCQAILQCEG